MNLIDEDLERLCQRMHDVYEAAAAGAGWETQEASRAPWSDVPEPNKVAMRAAVRALMDEAERMMMPASAAAVRRALAVGHSSHTAQFSGLSDERVAGYDEALRVSRRTLDYLLGQCSE